MSAYEFVIVGDPARARETASAALQAREFVMHWSGDWTATAIKGSKTKAALLGALSHYMEVGVGVMALDADNSVVRIDSLTTGWLGGIWGVKKTDDAFNELRDALGQAFDLAGVLVTHRNPATQYPS